jgi:hypothetical protein
MARWGFHPLESAAFARRTPFADNRARFRECLKLGDEPVGAKIWAAFFDSIAALAVRKDDVAAAADSAAGRAALVEEGWLEEAFASVERRGASGRAASGGQRRGRVIEPVRERLDQKGQEKMGQNPWLC